MVLESFGDMDGACSSTTTPVVPVPVAVSTPLDFCGDAGSHYLLEETLGGFQGEPGPEGAQGIR